MDQQSHYVGLDVSLETTSICVVDDAGAIIWRGKCSSDPDTITATLRQHAPGAVRVGLETGQLSNWLPLSLRRRGLPVVCMDARHAKAALSLQINKTDANDAHGLAQVVRTGWFREVAIKSMDAQTLRMLLVARAQLVSQRQAIANNIRGLLKTFGFVIARGSKGPFAIRVREVIVDNAALAVIVELLLLAWQALCDQVANLDRQSSRQDRHRRPTSDEHSRRRRDGVIGLHRSHRRSQSLQAGDIGGAYLGLTPRQSGEVDK